jgi:hypothetical protein
VARREAATNIISKAQSLSKNLQATLSPFQNKADPEGKANTRRKVDQKLGNPCHHSGGDLKDISVAL